MTGFWRVGLAGASFWAGVLLTAAGAAAGTTATGGAPIQNGVLVRCQSFRLRAVSCPAASDANVRLAKVLGGRCIPGITWFYDRRAIHVRGGCRALFLVGGAPQTMGQPKGR